MPRIRKSQNQPTISRTVWRIAVYIRLSKDDGLHCHFIILLYPNPKLVQQINKNRQPHRRQRIVEAVSDHQRHNRPLFFAEKIDA